MDHGDGELPRITDQHMGLTRGEFLRLAAIGSVGSLLAACAPTSAAPPAASTGAPDSVGGAAGVATQGGQADWETLLVDARKEGKVSVSGPPGTIYREVMAGFEAKYPEIKLEFQGANGPDFVARLDQERQAGLYHWDVDIHGPGSFDISAKKAGWLLPVRPALLLPEVLDESVWLGGFQRAFLDTEKQFVFSFQAESTPSVYVNRDLVPESELNSVKALVDPRWKGKIAIHEPRIDGAGNGRIAVWIGLLGEDFARSILRQDVAVTQDGRQLAEWLVRERYPVAIGVAPTQLLEFTRQGVGLNVKPITEKNPEAWQLNSGFGVVRLISNPPQPSAAKVFLNWLLSKDGQGAWVNKAQRATRRTDIPGIEGLTPANDVDYFAADLEEHLPLREQGKQVAKEVLG